MWYDHHCHWHFDFNMTVKQFPIFHLLEHIKKNIYNALYCLSSQKKIQEWQRIWFSSALMLPTKKIVIVLLPSEHSEHFVTLFHHFAKDRKCTSFSQKQRIAWAMVMFISRVSSSSPNKCQKIKGVEGVSWVTDDPSALHYQWFTVDPKVAWIIDVFVMLSLFNKVMIF